MSTVGVVTLVFHLFTLQPLAPRRTARLRTVVEVLLRPGIALGMLGGLLVHTEHFALLTYTQPFLESTSEVEAEGLALMLLDFGAINFVGTLQAGWIIECSPRGTMVLMQALVGVAALALFCTVSGVPVSPLGHGFRWCASGVVELGSQCGAGLDGKRGRNYGRLGAVRDRAGAAIFSFSGIAGVSVAAGAQSGR